MRSKFEVNWLSSAIDIIKSNAKISGTIKEKISIPLKPIIEKTWWRQRRNTIEYFF